MDTELIKDAFRNLEEATDALLLAVLAKSPETFKLRDRFSESAKELSNLIDLALEKLDKDNHEVD